MNKVVREHYPASRLPGELRGTIEPSASVTVTVQEEVSASPSLEEIRWKLLDFRKGLKNRVTIANAVERVRELRDDWDD